MVLPEVPGVGFVGCGNISDIYFKNAARFGRYRAAVCTDLNPERARAKADLYACRAADSIDAVVNDPEVDIVLNITPPAAHAAVTRAALEAGKHVYTEKPIATTLKDAQDLLALAERRGLLFCSAPDTFLGAGHQVCRAQIDAGAVGIPVAAVGFMLSPGPEGWHPDPEFFFQPGGGPLLDMGPYYLTAMVNFFGPIRSVTAASKASFPERTIGSGPKAGQKIRVNTPTHISGTLTFESGVLATLVMSFDCAAHELPNMQVYGSEGSLAVPDPNTFGGPVRRFTLGMDRAAPWEELPIPEKTSENSRGLGIIDLIESARAGREPRTSARVAVHVLEAMEAMLDAERSGASVRLATTCKRPDPWLNPLG